VHFPRAFLVGLAVLIVAGVVVVAVVLSQSGGSASHTSGSSASSGSGTKSATHHTRRTSTAAVNPANVTVAILNGTTIPRLAHKVAAKLVPPYREGSVVDAPDQTHTATIVAYLPGHRAAALAVARALGLRAAAVQAVDPSSENVACSGATPCTTDVVVTVGTDLASL
jgi:hypothetical protein